MEIKHIPVLLNETLEYLNCRKNGIYVDATLGHGNHALSILEKYPEIKMLVGIDQDMEAIDRTKKKLKPYLSKTRILHGNFNKLNTILEESGINYIDGILFDLGASTAQLIDPLRGFSFSSEGPLDMRMNRDNPLQAKDLLIKLSAGELEEILRKYGEERWAKKIARRIKEHLLEKPIDTTKELSDLVRASIPKKFYPKNIHPATKTFQALRITLNDELNSIDKGLENTLCLLNRGGRICIISFHSLEDRIVKNRFKDWATDCTCPKYLPVCTCKIKSKVKIITKKPVCPSANEIMANPRARSAKLRVAERI